MKISISGHSVSLSKIIIVALCASAFGPYIVPAYGLRLEHVVIYMSLAFCAITFLIRPSLFASNKRLVVIAGLFLLIAVWVLLVSLLTDNEESTIYSVVAGLENFVQPFALLIILIAVSATLPRTELIRLLRIAIVTALLMLSFNTVIAFLTNYIDTWPIIKYFAADLSRNQGESTVWQRSVSMARYSGIFGQPVESGLAYSVGLIGWVYLAALLSRISFVAWVGFIFIIIGGLISVSKVFLIGGLPLALLYWLWSSGRIHILKGRFLVWSSLTIISVNEVFRVWRGIDYLRRLFDRSYISEHGFLSAYTADRFGASDKAVITKFIKTLSQSPLIGFGYGSTSVLDNAYLEFFYYGGIVALVSYLIVLLILFNIAYRATKTGHEEGKLLMALWILVVGAGIGAPTLTLNRSSILIWAILVTAAILVSKKARHSLINQTAGGLLCEMSKR